MKARLQYTVRGGPNPLCAVEHGDARWTERINAAGAAPEETRRTAEAESDVAGGNNREGTWRGWARIRGAGHDGVEEA
jgi:hypothetical protein